MATTTPNYGLRKPTNADTVNVMTDISANMDLLDAHAHSGTYGPAIGSDAWLKLYAGTPDLIIAGAITRDGNEAATSAPVVWPDGSVGTYTATTVSSSFPGAVDAYTVTYGSPVTKTATQPLVTRDSAGAVTTRPALTVA